MVFEPTKWEYSNDKSKYTGFILPEPGEKYLCISNAMFDPDTSRYTLEFVNYDDEDEKFSVFYKITKPDANGNPVPNTRARATLITLGTAIFGKEVGLPVPTDVIGCIVFADVKLSKPGDDGRQFINIYEYKPIPESIAIASEKEQYFYPE